MKSLEAYINLPISDNIAARVSAYNVTEGGFIDLVGGTRTFSGSGYEVPLLSEDDHIDEVEVLELQ